MTELVLSEQPLHASSSAEGKMLAVSREEHFGGQQRQHFLLHRTDIPLTGREYSHDLAVEGFSFQTSSAVNGEQLVSSKGDSEQGTNICAITVL